MKRISVIVPCYNEEKYIAFCIDSILEQDYSKDMMEVFIVDGLSTDNTRNIINGYSKLYPYIQMLDNPEKIVPFALNKGIKMSKGDYIIRLDAHSSFPVNYFTLLIENALRYDADNVGGVCITTVKNKTKISLAIKTVLGHKFGVGNSLFRVGTSGPVETDTVPFGCFKQEVFDRFGYFDERLVRNQDIVLNKQIVNGGGKVFLIPDIKFTYFVKETFSAFINSNYQNGLWNILTVYYTKSFKYLSLRHFIPALFMGSLVLPAILSIIFSPMIWVSIMSFILYFSLIVAISIDLSIKGKQCIGHLILSFTALHLSYGWGSMAGIFKIFLKQIMD